MGIEQVVIPCRSPWQSRYVERLSGSIRRECLDHFIVLNERHLSRILQAYFDYYHHARAHLSLAHNSPVERENDRLSDIELADIVKRLSRMDTRSAGGPWTAMVLEAIHAHPKLVSTELATELEVQRDWLKPNIRKLKNLGLTISHERGYTLSPRGRRVLQSLARGID